MTAITAAREAAIAAALAAVAVALIRAFLRERARRERAEIALKQTEEWCHGLLDAQHDLICRVRPDLTLTFVNQACCTFWNQSRDQLLGERVVAVVPESMRDGLREQIEATVQSRQPRTRPYQIVLPGDTVAWQEWTHRPILDGAGAVVEVHAVGRDVTEQRHAERALSSAEGKASAILRAGPDLMFIMSPDGVYLDYHAASPEHLYAPPDRFLGRNVREIMPPDLADRILDALARVHESSEPIIVDYALSVGGEDRYYQTRLVTDDRGQVISVVRDMTDRRRAELALRQSEAVLQAVCDRNKDLAGRLIASQEGERRRLARELHDDLSQKLALMAIRIDQLQKTGAMSDSVANMVSDISRQTRDVASDVHRVSHQLHPFKLEALGLVAALEAVCADTRRQYGITVDFTHDGVPRDVDADVALCIYRITQESLYNVVKHSGAARAVVRLIRDDNDLDLQIVDRGCGFVPSAIDRDGLGLISIRERASFAGGQVTIQSKPGTGTMISLRVPLAVRREDASANSDSSRRSA